ncbi:MAG: DUF364 domain-containing protein [Elusimicrobiota bacterium]
MRLVTETIEKLKNLGIRGNLIDIIVTRTYTGPWTLTYVEYDDHKIGCGIANNETNLPDNTSFLKELIGLDSYYAIEKLENIGENVFIRSLKTSIASALSHRLMNDDNFLETAGYKVQSSLGPGFSLMDPSKLVKNADVVVTVGFHVMLTPLIATIAKKLYVTELMDLKELEVIDFKGLNTNLEILPANKNREILPQADVVYITGQTIVNDTLEEILDWSKNARTKIIYGPTSSFYPEILFKNGVDVSSALGLPNNLQFRQQFILSRGWWQGLKGIKMMLVRKEVNQNENE